MMAEPWYLALTSIVCCCCARSTPHTAVTSHSARCGAVKNETFDGARVATHAAARVRAAYGRDSGVLVLQPL